MPNLRPEQTKEKIAQTTRHGKQVAVAKAASGREKVRNGARRISAQARRMARPAVDRLTERTEVNERLARGLDGARDTVESIRSQYHGERTARLESYMGDLTTGADRVATALRAGDWREARREGRKVAVDHPEAVLGSAFLAGAFLGRLARDAKADAADAASDASGPSGSSGPGIVDRGPAVETFGDLNERIGG